MKARAIQQKTRFAPYGKWIAVKRARWTSSGRKQLGGEFLPFVYNPTKSKTVLLFNELGHTRTIQALALIECDH